MTNNSKAVMNSINNVRELYHELGELGVTLDGIITNGKRKWEKIGGRGFLAAHDYDTTDYVNNWMQTQFNLLYKRVPGELFCVNIVFGGHWGVEIDEPLFLAFSCKLNKSLREEVISAWGKTYVPTDLYFLIVKKIQCVYTKKQLFTPASCRKLMDTPPGWKSSDFDEISEMKFTSCPLMELGNTEEIKNKILKPLDVIK